MKGNHLTEKEKRKLKEKELELLQEMQKRMAINDYNIFSKSYIHIINKDGDKVTLSPNYVQREINSTVDRIRSQGRPVRIIVLKARQEGVSTNEQGRMTFNTTTKENRKGLIVAHRNDSTKSIFEKAKYMYDNLPAIIKPLRQKSNSQELVFDRPSGYRGKRKGLHSGIKIQTAGTVGIGRGDTFHYVHLSEFAFWEGQDDKSPIKQLTGIMQAVPKTPETEIIIESTANGFNDFKTLWDDAVAGKNGWTPLFFPWWVHEEYVKPFISEEQKDRFVNEMSEYEQFLLNDLNLPLERIHWWRTSLRIDCNNDINMMKQENPSTPEEAFLMSGTPVFDNEKVMRRIEYLRKKYEVDPYREGYFYFEWNDPEVRDFIKKDSIKFVDSKTKNYIRIYEEPRDMIPYVIGGDTKGEGKDFFAGKVINNSTSNRAAAIHMQLTNSKPYTWQMYCLGHYYNIALLSIEMNFNTAPIEELERLQYPFQYQRQKYDDFTKRYTQRYGWKTTGTTRPLIIDKQIDTVEEHIEYFNDIPTLQEMLTFVYDKNGRPDAMSGKHDDLLISDMIANETRGQQSRTTVVTEESIDIDKLPDDLQEDYYNALDRNKIGALFAIWKQMGVFELLKRKCNK